MSDGSQDTQRSDKSNFDLSKKLAILSDLRQIKESKEDHSAIFWHKIIGTSVTYEYYIKSVLKARYLEIESELRSILSTFSDHTKENNINSSYEIIDHIIELLTMAKGLLEKDKLTKKDLLVISSLLDESEESLTRILPLSMFIQKIDRLLSKISKLTDEHIYFDDSYINKLEKCKIELQKSFKNNEIINDEAKGRYAACIEEVVSTLNEHVVKSSINFGLRLEGLRATRSWGFILLVLFTLIAPIIAGIGHFTAIGFAIVGGIGGFLSGLLQVRGSQTNLKDYEISVLLSQIRPIFGAFAALVSLMLLKSGIFSDLIVESMRSYILIAFVSGFSERYFLQLIDETLNETSDTAIPQHMIQETQTILQVTELESKKMELKDTMERKGRYITLIYINFIFLVSCAIIRLYIFRMPPEAPAVNSSYVFILELIISILIVTITYIYYHYRPLDTKITELNKDIASSRATTAEEYFFQELIGININNQRQYYDLVKNHTEKSFTVSIIAGIIGFALIIASIYVGMENAKVEAAKLSAYAGIIIEFISAIFFYLYNRTVLQLKAYHDSLIDVQNALLSFRLVDHSEIQDQSQKCDMIKIMLSYLLIKKKLNIDELAPSDGSIGKSI
ncbi:MAG: TRADD-N-associated membrane domain-containing protein [Methanothrix sp.]